MASWRQAEAPRLASGFERHDHTHLAALRSRHYAVLDTRLLTSSCATRRSVMFSPMVDRIGNGSLT